MTVSHPARERFRFLGWAFALLFLAIAGIVLLCVALTSLGLIGVAIGLPMLAVVLPLTRRYADLHRLFAARELGISILRPYRPAPQGGWLARTLAALRDPATWRDGAWLFVNAAAGIAVAAFTIAGFFAGLGYLTLFTWWHFLPDDAELWEIGLFRMHDTASAAAIGGVAGVCYLALWWWLTPHAMRGYGLLARWLLARNERDRLAHRVRELTESRAGAVDSQAAELRRIERDLHDGAQARLVALGMSLGMAEQIVAKDPSAAVELLAEARQASTQALAELRDLVRGIHPPVLADRGLAGAIQALALASPLATTVQIDLRARLSAPVESAAYFAVAECLTNVVKHSRADQVWIKVGHADGGLTMVVGDDGRGGADERGGTGLRGIERRLSAFDGTLTVSSPPGGPTVVTMRLPAEPVGAATPGNAD